MARRKAPGTGQDRPHLDAHTSVLSAPLLPTASPSCCSPSTACHDSSSFSPSTLDAAASTRSVRSNACKPVSLLAGSLHTAAAGATHATSCQPVETKSSSQPECGAQRRVKIPWHKVPKPLGGTAGVLSDIDHVRWYTWTRLPYTKDGSRVYLFRCQAKRAPRKDAGGPPSEAYSNASRRPNFDMV